MQTLAQRLTEIRRQIEDAERQFKRIPGSVQLLAASKSQSIENITAAYELGQHHFGENYLREALDKMILLKDLPICWHFIGHIQSNKTSEIAGHFSWVHSVDRYKIAKRLSDQRPDNFKPLNICIQVNLDNEQSKGGVSPHALPELAQQIAELPRLHLRGLMLIPAPRDDLAGQKDIFHRLREHFERLVAQDITLDTLSMGMTGDFEAAIAEGATIIRIGTGIFGERR